MLTLAPLTVHAVQPGIAVQSAELVPAESAYRLQAEFRLDFPPVIEKALNKGVALDFLLEFQLIEPRRYWFDDEIISATRHIELSFHALSRQYLLKIGQHQQAFASWAEAKEALSRVADWEVFAPALVSKGKHYEALLRFRLDPSRLPKALQIEALGSEKWTMVSETYRWVPVF